MSKKTVGILIFDDAEVLDFAGPFEVFSVASELHNHALCDVHTIAKRIKPVAAVNGLSVNPDYDFQNCPHLDILILSGGAGARKILEDDETLTWCKSVIESSELTLSICSGSQILGKLGYLDDKPYCTHHSIYERMTDIVPTGHPQREKRFVGSSQKIYTAGGISAGIDLSFHIAGLLWGENVVKATSDYMEYPLQT